MITVKSRFDEKFITVIPYCPLSAPPLSNRLRVEKLCFWKDGRLEHPVNDQTILQFLAHAELYRASIYPDRPDLGCYAINNSLLYEQGEVAAHEIYYKDQLIYLRY